MANSNGNSLTLSQEFDKQLQTFNRIQDSTLATNDESLQIQIHDCKEKLEKITFMVSSLGLFSSNEILSEISSESIKFLLLPALLGCLTVKQVNKSREDILKISFIYFEDFIKRCKDYDITNIIVPVRKSADDENKYTAISKPPNTRPTPEDLLLMGQQREQKMKRYRERKEISERLKILKETSNVLEDEEIMREFYLTLINYHIYSSFDELESIVMEQDMLQQMKGRKPDPIEKEKKMPFRPFLLTKDDVQKKVFGAGYPSLPVMSVDEFYEMGIKEGRFGMKGPPRPVPNTEDLTEPTNEEEDGERERLKRRDDWRDDHRTGWGNTYNRS